MAFFQQVIFLSMILYIAICEAGCPEKCMCDTTQKSVVCHNAELDTVPWDLPYPVGLERLDLKQNDIKELLSEIVSYKNLLYLDLSRNEMFRINNNVFISLAKLKVLVLKDNRLDDVHNQVFKGLHALEILDISNNRLISIKDDSFSDLTYLETLDLSGNMIETVRDDAFNGLTNLKTLNFENNHLTAIPATALAKLHNLNLLKLNGNMITEISSYAFSGLPVHEISLDSNLITSFSSFAFGDSKLQSKLEKLSLRNNLLDHIPSLSLNQLKDLISIDLSSNPVTLIDPDAFKGMYNLEEFVSEFMPNLEVIRSYAFSELTKLQKVIIHSCPKLCTIEKDAFLASRNVNYVDLRSNALSSIDAHGFEWSKIKYLDLRNNPWNCDCKLDFLPAVLQTLQNKTLTNNVMCNKPDELNKTKISELTSTELKCEVQVKKISGKHYEDKIIIASIAFISCALVAVMVILMFCSKNTAFGTGQYPVVYRSPAGNQPTQNGHVCRSRDDGSEDRYPIANNEEHPNQDDDHADVQL